MFLKIIASIFCILSLETSCLDNLNQLEVSNFVTIVVIVPETHADAVRDAMGKAGAGKTEHYSFGSFSVKGISRFMPLSGSHPFIGTQNNLETVNEERIETICALELLEDVIKVIKEIHPYEETIIDIYPIYKIGIKSSANL
jgi:hypothetical protein